MNNILKTIVLVLSFVISIPSILAQDLSSQRGESQSLGKMLGSKLDHNGLVINPTPQIILSSKDCCEKALPNGGFELNNVLEVYNGVKLLGRGDEFVSDIDFVPLSDNGVSLRIEYGEKKARRCGVKEVSGGYMLEIDSKGIEIVAYDPLGAYYGIRTLEQIFASDICKDKILPELYIQDWPDLKYRGVVEGFYGTPWSHQVRLSLIDFYGQYKMNYYIYGPKDDPYHSSPHWRENYPSEQADNIKELVQACNDNRVHFVWAIHPGQDIKWNEEDYHNLLNKFESMYQLGVRAFAIHFDDISGEGTHPLKQTALMNRLNEEFVKPKGDVEPMIVCPTDYTRLWANPSVWGSLVRYGQTLDPSVDVFWTGDAVCSDMTKSTMLWVGSRIQRPALFWWNFPVTDYARHIIMQGPSYGLSPEINSALARGIVSNPMEHGEASKLALYSVADYAWNTEDYNPIDSWERGIETLAPEVAEAYRLFAIHSCDTETGYRRYESWETQTFTIDEYTPELSAALMEEFIKIEGVPAQMEQMENKALLEELRPWLVEFGKLGTRCRKGLELLDGDMVRPEGGKFDRFWDSYVENLMSEDDVAMYDAHRVGTMKLQPFYERVMDGLVALYYEYNTGTKSSTLSAYGSYNSLKAPQAKYMFDNDLSTYYHSGNAQRTNEFVAVDMSIVREVSEIKIIQGRNSIDDVDYFDHAIVEYSVDGESWIALTDSLRGVYDIEWKGEPFSARYIRLRKLESQKRNWLAIRSFEINPVEKSQFGWDGNPFTFYNFSENDGVLNVPIGTKEITLLCGVFSCVSQNCTCTILNNKGESLEVITINGPQTKIDFSQFEDVSQIVFSGDITLYEVIMR